MKNPIKAWIISATLSTMPLNVNANNFDDRWLQENINSELFLNLDKHIPQDIQSSENVEQLNMVWVKPKIVINAVLNYFDEDVKMFKLSQKAKKKLTLMLNPYLSAHPILKVWPNWNMVFVIDDKKAFAGMVKDFVTIVIDDMPFLVRKVVIPLFLGWHDTIQEKLSDLDSVTMDLKEKQYKDIILDNLGWFVKKVAISIKWNMTIGEYYDTIDTYYPNKNSESIRAELNNLWLMNKDIKSLDYPFKN